MSCYCGTDQKFSNCCEPYILGKKLPDSAEQLMRSRYTAYCIKKMDYIFITTDHQARDEFDHKGNEEWAQKAHFEKLEILKSEDSGTKGIVEFKATFKIDLEIHIHHEVSTFRKNKGQWFFRSGRVTAPEQKTKS